MDLLWRPPVKNKAPKSAQATFLVRLDAVIEEGREQGLDDKAIRKVLKDVRQRLKKEPAS